MGAVIRRGLSKIAVYRDDAGKLLTIGVLVPKRDGAVGSEIKELRLAALQDGGAEPTYFYKNGSLLFPICQASALAFTSSM
jgi:hypothetical protein